MTDQVTRDQVDDQVDDPSTGPGLDADNGLLATAQEPDAQPDPVTDQAPPGATRAVPSSRRGPDGVDPTPGSSSAVEPGVRGSSDDAVSAAYPDDQDGPVFANVYLFVRDFLTTVYARPVRDQGSWKWCARWWEHPEALSRLEALWLAFEALRQDPALGGATWWRDYADPTMTALSDPGGTFAKCGDRAHGAPAALPMEDPPAVLLTSGSDSGLAP
ncbi:MAG: DUF4913 domain-containing protein [Nocardioides sp.]